MWRRNTLARSMHRRASLPIVTFAAHFAIGGTAQSAVPLELDEESTHAQTADDEIVYELSLTEHKPFLIEVDQLGLDIVVTTTSEQGEESFDSPLLRDERELVLIEASQPGSYTITLWSKEYTGAIGGHRIRVRQLRDGETNRNVAAIALMSRGARANFEKKWADALAAYREAIPLLEASGDKKLEARAVFSAASLQYSYLGEWKSAVSLAARAADLYERMGEPSLYANAIHLQAAALIELANEVEKPAGSGLSADAQDLFDRALELFEQARVIHEQRASYYDASRAVNNIGLTNYYRGDWATAREYYREAAEIARSASEWSEEVKPLANLGVIEYEEGRITGAIDTYSRLLEILPQDRQQWLRAHTLDNLAAAHRVLGNIDEALQYYAEALDMHTFDEGRGRSLSGLGVTYFSAGELELAARYLQQSLGVGRQAGDGRGQKWALQHLGNVERYRRNFSQALRYHEEALSIATSPADRARVRISIGKDHIAAANFAEAIAAFSAALDTAQNAGVSVIVADALSGRGEALLGSGNATKARPDLRKALETYELLGLDVQRAETLYTLARASDELGKLEEAARHAAASVEHIERLRSRVQNPELRAAYLAMWRAPYDLSIDVLMRLSNRDDKGSASHLREALSISERARARAMVDLIHEAAVDVRAGVDKELAGEQERLFEQLAELRHRRDQMTQHGSTQPKASDELTARP